MGHDLLLACAILCELFAAITGFAGREPYYRGLLALGLFLFLLSVVKM